MCGQTREARCSENGAVDGVRYGYSRNRANSAYFGAHGRRSCGSRENCVTIKRCMNRIDGACQTSRAPSAPPSWLLFW